MQWRRWLGAPMTPQLQIVLLGLEISCSKPSTYLARSRTGFKPQHCIWSSPLSTERLLSTKPVGYGSKNRKCSLITLSQLSAYRKFTSMHATNMYPCLAQSMFTEPRWKSSYIWKNPGSSKQVIWGSVVSFLNVIEVLCSRDFAGHICVSKIFKLHRGCVWNWNSKRNMFGLVNLINECTSLCYLFVWFCSGAIPIGA